MNKKKAKCCKDDHIKVLFRVLNVLLSITGLGVLGLGAWTVIKKHSYANLLINSIYVATTYILIAAGILIIIVSIIGFLAVRQSKPKRDDVSHIYKRNDQLVNNYKRKKYILVLYILILLIILLMEIMAGALGLVYQRQLHHELMTSLNATFMNTYGIDEEKTHSIDDMQRSFHCCGASSFVDWSHSKWKLNTHTPNSVPESCCRTESHHCAIRDHPSNIYYIGCIYTFEDYIQNHLFILSLVALSICLVQVCGIICSSCLYVWMKSHEKYNQVPVY